MAEPTLAELKQILIAIKAVIIENKQAIAELKKQVKVMLG